MVQKVIISTRAANNFSDETEYLRKQFSDTEVRNFAERIDEKVALIIANPRLGRKIDKSSDIYKTVVNRRIILYYRYKPLKKEITILAFWNTLQDPRRLRL